MPPKSVCLDLDAFWFVIFRLLHYGAGPGLPWMPRLGAGKVWDSCLRLIGFRV